MVGDRLHVVAHRHAPAADGVEHLAVGPRQGETRPYPGGHIPGVHRRDDAATAVEHRHGQPCAKPRHHVFGPAPQAVGQEAATEHVARANDGGVAAQPRQHDAFGMRLPDGVGRHRIRLPVLSHQVGADLLAVHVDRADHHHARHLGEEVDELPGVIGVEADCVDHGVGGEGLQLLAMVGELVAIGVEPGQARLLRGEGPGPLTTRDHEHLVPSVEAILGDPRGEGAGASDDDDSHPSNLRG